MKQIIDGLTYNTETATEICVLGSDGNTSQRDFRWWSARLFITKKGRFFMAGRGGPMSPFAVRCGNGTSGSDGIIPLSHDQARSYAEREASPEVVEQFFDVEEA